MRTSMTDPLGGSPQTKSSRTKKTCRIRTANTSFLRLSTFCSNLLAGMGGYG